MSFTAIFPSIGYGHAYPRLYTVGKQYTLHTCILFLPKLPQEIKAVYICFPRIRAGISTVEFLRTASAVELDFS
jgi:hypothetical protein